MILKLAKLLVFLFFWNNTFGQIKDDDSPTGELSFHVGLMWRSTMMNVFNFQAVRNFYYDVPYPAEGNVQGLGLETGISYYFKYTKTGISYTPTFRYDFVHTGSITVVGEERNHPKQFLLDHNWALFWKIKRKAQYKKNKYWGIGYTIINFNKGFYVKNPPRFDTDYFNIQFHTWDIFVAFPIGKKFFIEPQVMYVPKTLPNNKLDDLLMYKIRFYFRQ